MVHNFYNLLKIIEVAPCAIVVWRHPNPNECESWSGLISMSSDFTPIIFMILLVTNMIFSCFNFTPFGMPVVPDVKIILETSLNLSCISLWLVFELLLIIFLLAGILIKIWIVP